MSASLQGPELNYPTIDKHTYAVYKAVNHFQPYLLKNWMTVLEEYDFELNPVHMIKGHGLCHLAVEVVDAKEEEYPSGWQ